MGTDKIIYFSVFLPKQLNFSSNSGGSFFFYKLIIIVRSITKNYRKFFRNAIFYVTYTMFSNSVFTYIMTIISNFKIFVVFNTFIFKLFLQMQQIFPLLYNSCCSFVNIFIFKIFFHAVFFYAFMILYTLRNLMEYFHLFLLQMNFQHFLHPLIFTIKD